MYMIPNMIDMGLKEGEEWPTQVHKEVAMSVLLCNPSINTKDKLTEGVSKILKIPNDVIKTVTINDLPKYGFCLNVDIV